MSGAKIICSECWVTINGPEEVEDHAVEHQAGTDSIPIRACPKGCGSKETVQLHPEHKGRRCNMPTGRLGVVSCYCGI